MKTHKKLDFCGMEMNSLDLEEAAATVLRLIRDQTRKNGASVHFVNAYTIALADSNREYLSLLRRGTLLLPDGKPISWFSGILGTRLSQVRGPDFFEKVIDLGREQGIRHFFLGATSETLDLLTLKFMQKYPGVIIAGTYSPPFRKLSSLELAEQDSHIQSAKPDLVWVSLGTPKQDFETSRVSKSTNLVSIAVGAAFDFSAGTKPIAPRVLRVIGLEWLFRLISEPKRLWKRYLMGNLVFLRVVLKHILAQSKKRVSNY